METKNCTRFQKGKKFLGLCISSINPQPLENFYDVTGIKGGIKKIWKSERCKACLVSEAKIKRLAKNGGITKPGYRRPKPDPVLEKNCSKFKKGECASPNNPQPIENFRFKIGRVNGSSICKSCEQKYLEENRDKALARVREWQKLPENKEKRKRADLMKLYGITKEEFHQMVENQKGCCGICNIHESNVGYTLNIDHCHKSGKVRMLLCSRCNQGLGMFKDDIALLEKAVDYLKRFKTDVD